MQPLTFSNVSAEEERVGLEVGELLGYVADVELRGPVYDEARAAGAPMANEQHHRLVQNLHKLAASSVGTA